MTFYTHQTSTNFQLFNTIKNLRGHLRTTKMEKRPILEEVNDDDIDNMDMDLAEFDPTLKTPIAPMRPPPSISRSQDSEPPLFPNLPMQHPIETPETGDTRNKDIVDPNKFSEEERRQLQKFQIIYPCYFDKERTHQQGRRVSTENAVVNPLAKTISDACRSFNLPVLLELDKSHPQDFGNPGRVRVMLKDVENEGKVTDPRFSTKRALMNSISDFLKSHPTTLKSIDRSSGIPWPREYEDGFEPEEIPKVKGFKMNTIVPVHSNFTLKHPMTKSVYTIEPEQSQEKIQGVPKVPKKKVMRIRG